MEKKRKQARRSGRGGGPVREQGGRKHADWCQERRREVSQDRKILSGEAI